MPLTESDIEYYLSGGADNTDPDASLGGAISSTAITDNTDNNLFDDVSGDEASAGDTEYRCFYVKNDHSSITWKNVKIWINAETPGSDQLDIALDDGGKNATAETIADESTAPSGESFSHPTDKASGLSLGDLAPGDYYAIWVKRVVPADCAAYAANAATFRTEGEWTE